MFYLRKTLPNRLTFLNLLNKLFFFTLKGSSKFLWSWQKWRHFKTGPDQSFLGNCLEHLTPWTSVMFEQVKITLGQGPHNTVFPTTVCKAGGRADLLTTRTGDSGHSLASATSHVPTAISFFIHVILILFLIKPLAFNLKSRYSLGFCLNLCPGLQFSSLK